MSFRLLSSLSLVLACSAPEPTPANTAPAEVEEAEAEPEAEARSFGEPFTLIELTNLPDITANPESFAGQTVKTEGEITQVCQRMGCWMEMREGDGPAIRVPMAGHSFFLPRDVSGHRATIEGQVALRELSAAEREHLESEGAQAVGQRLQITATGVEIH